MLICVGIFHTLQILVFLFLHCITYVPRFTHLFSWQITLLPGQGEGGVRGNEWQGHLLSDQELFPWRIAAANQTIPEVSPFFRSPVSMHVFCWWPSPAWWCTLTWIPSSEPRPASLQMHCLVEKMPAARTAAWMFHHPHSVHLVSCLLPLSCSTYWGWITVLHYFPCPHGPQTYDYLVLIARHQFCGHLVLRLSFPHWEVERGLRPLLLWEGGTPFPTAATLPSCLAAFALGLVCWLMVPGTIFRLGGNGFASEFSCELRTATKALQFPTVWLAMLWQQKIWWWVFLLILESIATQIVIATTVYCVFPMWWPFDTYFHLAFAATVENLPAMQDTWVWSLGREDTLDKVMTIHCNILAWRIP